MATPVIHVTIDSTTLFIGDQTDLHIQVTHTPNEMVQMPVYGEQLIPGIEIVDRTIVDTIKTSDGNIQLHQYLTLTSFKDSLFYIAPILIIAGGETLYSESLSLNVIQPFEVDTTLAITPIKDIYRAPIWWWGIIRWVLLAMVIIGLCIGAYFAWRKWGYLLTKQQKPEEPVLENLRPAEEIALEKLDIIKQQKIWQDGQIKEYHTQLTNVIREYISRRFDISSSEKTSDETLRELKPVLNEQRGLFTGLSKMLQLADLVKFAKWTTTPDENEDALRMAYTFVQETTPVPEEAPSDTTTTQP